MIKATIDVVRHYLAELLVPGLSEREAVYLLDRTRWHAALGRRDRDIEALAQRVLDDIPRVPDEPTLDVYHDLKEAWKTDDELICYPFPAMAICPHEGYQYYLSEAYSATMALLVFDKLKIFMPSPERQPDYYDKVRNNEQ